MPYKDPEKQKAAQKAYYDNHKSAYKERLRKKRVDDYAWLYAQKQNPCADCQSCYHPAAMDFHHRDPSTKVHNVVWLLVNRGRQAVIDEIAKCDLICSNCHRIRHYHANPEHWLDDLS